GSAGTRTDRNRYLHHYKHIEIEKATKQYYNSNKMKDRDKLSRTSYD
ncbi:unnamed protein product, partial [Amoebophrya sp. A120]